MIINVNDRIDKNKNIFFFFVSELWFLCFSLVMDYYASIYSQAVLNEWTDFFFSFSLFKLKFSSRLIQIPGDINKYGCKLWRYFVVICYCYCDDLIVFVPSKEIERERTNQKKKTMTKPTHKIWIRLNSEKHSFILEYFHQKSMYICQRTNCFFFSLFVFFFIQ